MKNEELWIFNVLDSLSDDDESLETIYTSLKKSFSDDQSLDIISITELSEIIKKCLGNGLIFINYTEYPITIKYGCLSSFNQVWFARTKYGDMMWDELFVKYKDFIDS